MKNLNSEAMAEKVALAIELSRKKAEKKKAKEQGKATGTLKTKVRAPPRPRGSKRTVIETSAPDQSSPKCRGPVDMTELRDSLSGGPSIK